MDSSNAVLLNQDTLTGVWKFDEYGIVSEHCSPPPVPPLTYGNEVLYDLTGTEVSGDSAEREPWLRESQFPHATDNWIKN